MMSTVRSWRAIAWWVVAVVATAILAAGCGPDDSRPVGAQPTVPPSIYPVAPSGTGTTVPDAEPDADAAATTAAYVRPADGVDRPNPEVTPGASFADVDAAVICELHYTQGVRQPRYNAKVEAFARYGVSIRDREFYRLDHLVPLSLGGNNEDQNLWPQPYDDVAGARQKDQIERQLRGLVCSGTISLAEAQAAIATDWWAAHQTYMGMPIVPGSDGLPAWDDDPPEPGEVVNGGPCTEEGAIGLTDPKRVRLTCEVTGDGQLRWQKRD